MALAHDVSTTATAYTSTGTQTTSHVASASARAAVVLIDQNASTADQVSGVTYGGVDMKRLRFDTEATETGGVYIYWLDEVPTGTQNVAMTTTGTANKQLSVSTMTVASGKVVRPVGVGNTATSASAANPALTLSGLTASTVYQCYEVIHSGLTTMTTTPQSSPAWTLISSTDLGSQGRGFARINNTPGGTTITAGWIAATADDYVISGVAFYETDPPSADGLPNGALAAWWAADDLALADNDPVTSWADRVTGLALAEATNPPTFKTGILNGLPAVRFSTSGTDDSLQTASTVALFNAVRGGTIFVVAKSTAPQATFQTFVATDTTTAGTDRFSVYATSTDGYLGQYGRRLDGDGLVSKPSTTVAPSTAAIIRAVSDWSAGTYDLRIGGTSVGSGAYTSAGATSFTDAAKFRVGRSNTANYGLEGDIYEVIVYERVLTAAEITVVEDYLTAKWLTAPGTDATFTGALGGDSADGGSATFAASSTFTGAVGGDNASGASASLTGSSTFTGSLGGDTADGGSASFTASSAFTANAGGDTGDGAAASFTASSTFTAQVGGDAASGASASFTGTSPDATFSTTAGGDAADGSAASFTGTGTFTGALGGDAADGSTASLTASSAFTANAGGDTANGGSASLTGSATFSGTVGGDSASGAAASFTVTGDATFTATAGGDAADGGTASLTASSTFTGSAGGDTGTGSAASFTGSGTFSTLVATADADGNVALMAGSATFATLDSTSTAEGATVSFVLELPPESGRAEGASPAAPGIRHDNPAAATVGAAPATASSTTGGDGTAPAVVGAAPTTPRAGG